MAQPRLFIGSSQKNLRVAQLLASSLEDLADVEIWNEGVFGLGYGILETLLKKLEDYDFAAFVLAPDDMTNSKDESKPAPRDNVLFESGLFMGVMGRDRVFLVYDPNVGLKIPSDLAGVTLATYDGARLASAEAKSAVRDAALKISERISASRFPYLVGDWKSQYPMTFEEGCPMVSEEMSVRTSGDMLTLVTKTSSHDDFYSAWGRIAFDHQILGKWRSRAGMNNMEGLFMLTISPKANYMYGYFTTPDEYGGTVYATWVLSKMEGSETEVAERLQKAANRLKKITFTGPQCEPPPAQTS